MKYLFTGSRDHPYAQYLDGFLESLFKPGDEVVVGDNNTTPRSIDKAVRDYCEANDVPYTVHYADWDTHGRAAGPLRNKAMVDTKPDLVIAFPWGESRGTRNCIKLAKEAGLQVIVMNMPEPDNFDLGEGT